jgi:hypothetical protein
VLDPDTRKARVLPGESRERRHEKSRKPMTKVEAAVETWGRAMRRDDDQINKGAYRLVDKYCLSLRRSLPSTCENVERHLVTCR